VVRETYTHGHHASVLASHTWRTAENSAAYLLPHLSPGAALLDLGCGPGTITVDLAARVAPGPVVGIDAAFGVLAEAAGRAAIGGARFAVCAGDAYALPFGDAAFDVVHAHQVLQHLAQPVTALVEMGRVLRRGGLLAVRDSDYAAFTWAPVDPWLDRWLDLYHRVTAANGGEADAGRHLFAWVREAGFSDPVATSSTWTFADPESRAWWGGLWADRVRHSAFAAGARDLGLATEADLEAMAGAFLRWAANEDGFFCVPHTEVLATR
jgi:ubiquinone/menaquinone biosynthesis C-methylase UbiE